MADGTIATAIGAPPPVAYVADQPLTDAQAAALASLRSRGAAGGAGEPAAGAASGGPRGMAAGFGVPYLGALPIDPVLLASCEAGQAYVVRHPTAVGVAPLLAVIGKVVVACEGEGASLDRPYGEGPPDGDEDGAAAATTAGPASGGGAGV